MMALRGELIEEKNPPSSEISMVEKIDVDRAVDSWNAYKELCEQLLDDSDYQNYRDQKGNIKKFPKKSAWFKLGRAFNVDIEIVDREVYRSKTGKVLEAYYRVRATLPNGSRYVEADATCDRDEKGKRNASAHDLRATAETRATNRAIAKLIGAGEVSSEELNSGELKICKED